MELTDFMDMVYPDRMEFRVSPTQYNPYIILLAETSIFGLVLVKILLFIQQLYIHYPQWAETILGTRITEMPSTHFEDLYHAKLSWLFMHFILVTILC